MTWSKIIVGVGAAALIIIIGGKKLNFKALFSKDGGTKIRETSPSEGKKKQNDKMKEYYSQLSEMCDRVAAGEPDKDSRFEVELSRCFKTWCELQCALKEEERANIVLSGFHGNDGLKSKLSDVCEYVNTELTEEIDAAGIVSSGFNSCLNFAWLDYKRTRDKLEGVVSEYGQVQPDFYDFCREMSYRGGAFSNLYKALSMGRDRIVRHKPVSYEDEELCSLLKDVIFRLRPEDYGIEEATTELNRKLKKQAQTIADAKNLRQDLESLMREDRILAMRDQSAQAETLKNLYREMAQDVGDLLRKYGES